MHTRCLMWLPVTFTFRQLRLLGFSKGSIFALVRAFEAALLSRSDPACVDVLTSSNATRIIATCICNFPPTWIQNNADHSFQQTV